MSSLIETLRAYVWLRCKVKCNKLRITQFRGKCEQGTKCDTYSKIYSIWNKWNKEGAERIWSKKTVEQHPAFHKI